MHDYSIVIIDIKAVEGHKQVFPMKHERSIGTLDREPDDPLLRRMEYKSAHLADFLSLGGNNLSAKETLGCQLRCHESSSSNHAEAPDAQSGRAHRVLSLELAEMPELTRRRLPGLLRQLPWLLQHSRQPEQRCAGEQPQSSRAARRQQRSRPERREQQRPW